MPPPPERLAISDPSSAQTSQPVVLFSQTKPASSTLLSEQTNTNTGHQSTANRLENPLGKLHSFSTPVSPPASTSRDPTDHAKGSRKRKDDRTHDNGPGNQSPHHLMT
jgi:hypothetical protein